MTGAHANLSSYEGVEDLDTFDAALFTAYCESKLRSADHHAAFVRELLAGGRVCEIGSGNGKLLYNLERTSLLTYGVGFEVSASRHRFAERFGGYVGSTRVKNRHADILAVAPERAMDLCLGVDVVMCLIAPVAPDAEQRALRWCFESLRPGGALVLEFCDWSSRLREIKEHGGALRTWRALPPPDPWEYVLETNTRAGPSDILWDKLFLKRNAPERSRLSMVLRSYTREAALALLAEAGFIELRVYAAWTKEAPMNPGEFIVVGRSP